MTWLTNAIKCAPQQDLHGRNCSYTAQQALQQSHSTYILTVLNYIQAVLTLGQHNLEDAAKCINIRKSTVLPGTANSVQSFITKDHRSLLQTTFLHCKEESVALCLSGRPSMSTSPAAINTIATHTIYSICLHKFHVLPKQAPCFKSEPLAQCSNVIWVEKLQQLPGNCRHLLF